MEVKFKLILNRFTSNNISGLVLIFGIQRTRVLWDIVKRNRGTRAGLLRAGWVSLGQQIRIRF